MPLDKLLINCHCILLDFFFSCDCFRFVQSRGFQSSGFTEGLWEEISSSRCCLVPITIAFYFSCGLQCFSFPYAGWKQFGPWNWRISYDLLEAQRHSIPIQFSVPFLGLSASAPIPCSSHRDVSSSRILPQCSFTLGFVGFIQILCKTLFKHTENVSKKPM